MFFLCVFFYCISEKQIGLWRRLVFAHTFFFFKQVKTLRIYPCSCGNMGKTQFGKCPIKPNSPPTLTPLYTKNSIGEKSGVLRNLVVALNVY